MGQTRDGGADLVPHEYREVIANEMADFLAQNPEQTMVYLVFADAQPAVDIGGPHKIPPGQCWVRTNTEDTPLLQGKAWMRADKEMTIAITE